MGFGSASADGQTSDPAHAAATHVAMAVKAWITGRMRAAAVAVFA